jgi:tRNA(Ile)-lysidine synthase
VKLESIFHKEWTRLTRKAKQPLRVVVGVSGGVDSVVLLSLVLKEVPASRVIVAHFDHQVRSNSSADSSWVKKTAEALGISEVIIGKRKGKGTSEAELRKERYSFLKKVQTQSRADFLVVGHHLQDQLETLLMRLLRGTGAAGLGGISAKRGSLLRPLLKTSKEQILCYAQKKQLTFCEDETNQDIRYFRNLVRKELVPVFLRLSEKHGGAEKALRRINLLAEELQEANKENKKRAKKWLSTEVHQTPFWIRFSRNAWKKESRGVQTSIANQLWVELTGESLEREEIRQLQQAILNQKKTVLSGKVEVIASCEQVYLQTPSHKTQLQKAKGQKDLISFFIPQAKRKQLCQKWKKEEVELRFLKPGDRYKGKKMKRHLLAHRVPSPERELLPVVARCKSSEILWYFPLTGPYRKCFSVPWSSFSETSV